MKTPRILLLATALAAALAASAQDPGPAIPPDNVSDPLLAPMMPGEVPTPLPNNQWAVTPHDFQMLMVAIQSQTFASNQLPMIQAAGLCGWFTCEQCAALMNIFDFDDNKLRVVQYLARHLIDPIRCQPILQSLSFVDDQQKAWRIISAAQP